MKHLKTMIIGVLCAALVFGYYYYLSTRDHSEQAVETSKVADVISLNMKDKYPPTPREVVNVYNQILSCYYNEDYTDKEFQKMLDKQRALMDEELLEINPETQMSQTMRNDVNNYKSNGKTIASYTLCSTDDVVYKEVDGEECAYVDCFYFIKNGNKGYENSCQRYVLRKDADGNWKILTYYLVKGESSGE